MGALEAVLVQKSTGSIIKYGLYPRADMAAIEGLDPDYEYLVRYEPFVAPDYDSRYYILKKVETITTEAHPIYPHLNVYKSTYKLDKRDISELEFHVRQAQKQADTALCNTEDQLSFTLKVQAAIDRSQQGLALTVDEQAILDKSRYIKVKLDKNQDNYNLIIGLVSEGLEPDIDAGWENY